jgi:phage terminase large subunit
LIYKDCVNTIREFGSYVWDKKAAERGEDKPVKFEDHCMDALRYYCMTVIRIRQALGILKPGGY